MRIYFLAAAFLLFLLVFFSVSSGLRIPPSSSRTFLFSRKSVHRVEWVPYLYRLSSKEDSILLSTGRQRSIFPCLSAVQNKKESISSTRIDTLKSFNVSERIHSLGDDQKNITQLLFPQNQNNKKSLGYNPNATVTMGELKEFLLHNQFITKSELMSSLDKLAVILPSRKTNAPLDSTFDEVPMVMKKSGSKSTKGATIIAASGTLTSTGTASRGGVGLPQQSILTDKVLVSSTTFATGAIGFIISRTVAANLWLIGLILGATYGNSVATEDVRIRSKSSTGVEGSSSDLIERELSRGIISKFILSCGRRCGRFFLTVYDAVNVLWYMYKTGKLSYSYYKQYESLDSRFQITDKIDAWNARFQEGKRQFDQWEKENEISRRLLAGLRTFWLVEEQSYKRTSKKYGSQNRIVMVANTVYSYVTRFFHAMWKLMKGGGNTEELDDLLKGIQADISELNFVKLGQQLGSGLTALVAVNVIAALFLISPGLVGAVCFVCGMIWPTWIGGAYRRFTKKISDTADKGRRDMALKKSASEGGRYHYFIREDGTKRWYRTGRPVLNNFFMSKDPAQDEKKSKNINYFFSKKQPMDSTKKNGFFLNWRF